MTVQGRLSIHGEGMASGIVRLAHDGVMPHKYPETGQTFTAEERAHAHLSSSILSQVIGALAQHLGPRTEVLVHDLTRMPASIVAIAQPITGRQVGGPPTDLSLILMASQRAEDVVGYASEFEGKTLRSTSSFVRAPSGRAVVALCINSDVDEFVRASEALARLTAISPIDLGSNGHMNTIETFAPSVESLSEGILREELSAVGVPVDLMKKKHKLAVVRSLKLRGFYELRDAVDVSAKALNVTRYTIYNYLNEIAQVETA
jgi:predicted transcriptional regulator YheO